MMNSAGDELIAKNRSTRPTLTLVGKQFYLYHGDDSYGASAPARVVFRRGHISVGCTDADVSALRELLRRYDEWASEYVVQP